MKFIEFFLVSFKIGYIKIILSSLIWNINVHPIKINFIIKNFLDKIDSCSTFLNYVYIWYYIIFVSRIQMPENRLILSTLNVWCVYHSSRFFLLFFYLNSFTKTKFFMSKICFFQLMYEFSYFQLNQHTLWCMLSCYQ